MGFMLGGLLRGRSPSIEVWSMKANKARTDQNRAALGAAYSALGLVPHPAATVVSTVGSAGLTLAGAYSNDKAAETGVSPSDYNASIVT